MHETGDGEFSELQVSTWKEIVLTFLPLVFLFNDVDHFIIYVSLHLRVKHKKIGVTHL